MNGTRQAGNGQQPTHNFGQSSMALMEIRYVSLGIVDSISSSVILNYRGCLAEPSTKHMALIYVHQLIKRDRPFDGLVLNLYTPYLVAETGNLSAAA